MKRKFGFSLPPLKIAQKADVEDAGSLPAGDLLSPISPPPSPLISRQSIDPLLVAQLKASCAAIVSGCSHDPEPQLNFKPLGHAKSSHNLGRNEDRPLRGTRGSTTHVALQWQGDRDGRVVAGSKSVNNLKQVQQRVVDEPSTRQLASASQQYRCRRDASVLGFGSQDAQDGYAPEIVRTKKVLPMPPQAEESDGSHFTSRTGSTDRRGDSQSTSSTSAAHTPARFLEKTSSNLLREDTQLQRLVQKWEEQAKASAPHRQRPTSHQPPRRVEIATASRPDMRALGLSAAEGLHKRSASANVDAEGLHKRSGSANVDAKTWGLGAAGQQGRDKSIGTQGTHFESRLGSKSIANLKELPPLPPISSWTEQAESDHTQLGLRNEPEKSAAPWRKGTARVDSANTLYKPEHHRAASSSSAGSTKDGEPRVGATCNGNARVAHSSSAHSAPTQPSMVIPNFSRKISIDVNGAIQPEVCGLVPPQPPPKSTKGLRRILSKFDGVLTARERAGPATATTWMDYFERGGIHSGILQERKTGAPIVRY